MLDSLPVVDWKRTILSAWLLLAIGYIALIPVSNNFLLYPLLFSLGLIAGIGILRDGSQISPLFLAPAGLWLTFVAYGTLVAITRDAASWPRTLVFFLFWPVFYSVVVIGFKRNLVKVIFYIGAAITIFISVVFLLGGLVTLGHMPIDSLPSWIASPLGLRIVISNIGAIALTAHSLPPLMWWGAMWVAALALGENDRYLPPMYVRFLAGSFAIAASIVAWRRGIVIVMVLIPLIMLTTWLLLNVRNTRFPPKNGLGIVVRVIACYTLALALSVGVQSQAGPMFAAGAHSMGAVLGLDISFGSSQQSPFLSNDDQLGDKIRTVERGSLTKGTSAPDAVFGHGIGASFPRGGITRAIKPWQTELQYHGLYYWTGVIGMILLISTLAAALYTLRRAYKIPDGLRGVLYVSCTGAAATLIGNATNPYLQAPGHMWPVFFPFMIAGVIVASQKTDDFPGKRILIPKMTGYSRVKVMRDAELGVRPLRRMTLPRRMRAS